MTTPPTILEYAIAYAVFCAGNAVVIWALSTLRSYKRVDRYESVSLIEDKET